MWGVGVAGTGNEFGLDETAAAALPREEFDARLASARARFVAAGAHYVVDSVAALPDVVAEISDRLARGETPMAALAPEVRSALLSRASNSRPAA